MPVRCRGVRRICIAALVLYLLGALLFLAEAGMDPETTSRQTKMLATFVSSVFTGANTATLTTENGEVITALDCVYDPESGSGTLVRVYPTGGKTSTRVESATPQIVEVQEYTTPEQGSIWLLRACGVGRGKVTVFAETDGFVSRKSIRVTVRESEGYQPPVFRGIRAADNRTVPGKLLHFSAEGTGIRLDDAGSALLWESSDPDILALTGWGYDAAGATFRAKAVGTCTVSARSLLTGERVGEMEVMVEKAYTAPGAAGEGGVPLSELQFTYSEDGQSGDVHRIYLTGSSHFHLISSNAKVISIVQVRTATGSVPYLCARGAGEAVITLEADTEEGIETFTYPYTVSPVAGIGGVSPTVTVSTETLYVDGSLTLGVQYPDNLPAARRAVFFETVGGDGVISLYSADPGAGKAVFHGDAEGVATVRASDLSTGKIIYEKEFSVTKKPVKEPISYYRITRKGLGHAGWCLALGFLGMFGFLLLRLGRRHYPFVLSLGLSIAALSEWIQWYVPGRGCTLQDVGIDFAGYAIGTLLALPLLWLLFRQQKKRTESGNARREKEPASSH